MLRYVWCGLISGLNIGAIALTTEAMPVKPTRFSVDGARLEISLPAPVKLQPLSDVGLEIVVSDRIQLVLETLADDRFIAEYRKDTLANTGIFKRLLVDSPTALLHEDSLMGQSAYRVITYIKANSVNLTCRDKRVVDLTEAEARTVIQWCQTIRSAP